MRKKYTILTIGLIVFLVMVYFLYTPSISDSNFKVKNPDDDDKETTQVKGDVDLIDYLNLEAENRLLKEEIDSLKTNLFEYRKAFIDPDSNDISQYYENVDTLVYKEVTDNEIILLVRNETVDGDGYRLTISSKDIDLFNDLSDLKNNEIINYTGTDGFYSGLIKENEFNAITVSVNDKFYEAEIVNFADDISFWYTVYEHKRKSMSEEPDKIRIEAMNGYGEVLWEESFDGNLGG